MLQGSSAAPSQGLSTGVQRVLESVEGVIRAGFLTSITHFGLDITFNHKALDGGVTTY